MILHRDDEQLKAEKLPSLLPLDTLNISYHIIKNETISILGKKDKFIFLCGKNLFSIVYIFFVKIRYNINKDIKDTKIGLKR